MTRLLLSKADTTLEAYGHREGAMDKAAEYTLHSETELWTLNLIVIPLYTYGETIYKRLACFHDGQYQGTWMGSEGLTGTDFGWSHDEVIDRSINSYRAERMTWRGVDGKLH